MLQALGCTPENLLPTTHGILGVTRTPLNILGILPVRVTSGECTTNQIMYFSQNTRGCLLSEKALIDLHILSEQFPSSTNTSSTMLLCPPSVLLHRRNADALNVFHHLSSQQKCRSPLLKPTFQNLSCGSRPSSCSVRSIPVLTSPYLQ